MKTRFLLISLPLMSFQPFAILPVMAAGSHNGWCNGVGNPHQSSSCSSTPVDVTPGTNSRKMLFRRPINCLL
jgi:hypothetical protein